jgi:hypothetical protein
MQGKNQASRRFAGRPRARFPGGRTSLRRDGMSRAGSPAASCRPSAKPEPTGRGRARRRTKVSRRLLRRCALCGPVGLRGGRGQRRPPLFPPLRRRRRRSRVKAVAGAGLGQQTGGQRRTQPEEPQKMWPSYHRLAQGLTALPRVPRRTSRESKAGRPCVR